jgi:hypothetical protein
MIVAFLTDGLFQLQFWLWRLRTIQTGIGSCFDDRRFDWAIISAWTTTEDLIEAWLGLSILTIWLSDDSSFHNYGRFDWALIVALTMDVSIEQQLRLWLRTIWLRDDCDLNECGQFDWGTIVAWTDFLIDHCLLLWRSDDSIEWRLWPWRPTIQSSDYCDFHEYGQSDQVTIAVWRLRTICLRDDSCFDDGWLDWVKIVAFTSTYILIEQRFWLWRKIPLSQHCGFDIDGRFDD